MRPVARFLVFTFAIVLSVLPALREGCDLSCGTERRTPIRLSGHCASHDSSPAPSSTPMPTSRCGHDHSTSGTLTPRAVAPPASADASALPAPTLTFSLPHPERVGLVVPAVRGTPGLASTSLPLRI
jgi:hypothetical protein